MCQLLIAMDRKACNYVHLHMPKNISMVEYMWVRKREMKRQRKKWEGVGKRDIGTERGKKKERLQEKENKGKREEQTRKSEKRRVGTEGER